MAQAQDLTIWHHACQEGAVLITKDEDFVSLRTLSNNGTAVIWVRLGNTTRRQLLASFARLLPDIEQALTAGETLIEID